MILKVVDGIEIVVDDEKLITWQQSNDKRFVLLEMVDGSKYELDTLKKVFFEVSNGK